MPNWLKSFAIVVAFWLALIVSFDIPNIWFHDYGLFTLLGVAGAIFANATGAGGGVVFVPFFNHLGFSSEQIVATSFAIQCCGMTAGALTWFFVYQNSRKHEKSWKPLLPVVIWVTPMSVLTILVAQYQGIHAPASLTISFSVFSLILALAVFATLGRSKATHHIIREKLDNIDRCSLVLIGIFGGLITKWLSVGVGELLAVYLILRGYNVTLSIAAAVIVSAFSVWSAIGFHLVETQGVYFQVVLFAGLGAILGGLIAKFVVLAFSPMRLKIFFATWILLLGFSGLPIFQL